jgi:Zn-dependent protease with chaperone function
VWDNPECGGDGGKPVVGLNPQLLSAGLNKQESEALMAHETGHIIIGDTFKPPGFFDVSRIWSGLPVVLATVLLVIELFVLSDLAPRAEDSVFAYSIVAICILPVLFIAVVAVGFYIGRDIQTNTPEMDLMADTIACKLTSDPDSLIKAIEKLDRAGLATHILTRREDMKWIGTNPEMMKSLETNIYGLLMAFFCWMFVRSYTPAVMLESGEMITTRLRSLEDLKRGHRAPFEEVTAGKIRTPPEAWE